jgi:regulator of ribonuclease activity A
LSFLAETLSAFEGAGVVDKVLQSSGEGKILVVDGGGNKESAIFDAKAARTAQQNGWKGVIINGVVRNAKELSTFSIGIKALGTSPKKGQATSGSKGSVVTIGGMNFSPGDNVYCDTVRNSTRCCS